VIEAADTCRRRTILSSRDCRVEQGEVARDPRRRSRTHGSKDLFDAGVPLKDYSEPANLIQAQNDMAFFATAAGGVEPNCRILYFSEESRLAFQESAASIRTTTIYLSRCGHCRAGQVRPPVHYVNSGASDPSCVIGDLSPVWLTALRPRPCIEGRVGTEISFNVLALPGRRLLRDIDSSPRQSIRRRAGSWFRARHLTTKDGPLKPEGSQLHALLPLRSPGPWAFEAGLIYEGEQVGSGLRNEDKSIELREIQPLMTNGNLVRFGGNLKPPRRAESSTHQGQPCSSTARIVS